MRYEIRPISDRTPFAGRWETSPFTASWADTLVLLDRELVALDAKDVVFEVDVLEGEIRLDGMLRNDAKTATPAVRLAFQSKHGPLSYATDRYLRREWDSRSMQSWQHNLRAIALGLEALRRVDRYGITQRGEQYAGWLQIEAGPSNGVASHMTRQAAAELLEQYAIGEDGYTRARMIERLLNNRDEVRATLRHARATAHPDRHNGDRTLWDQVEQAARILDAGHR